MHRISYFGIGTGASTIILLLVLGGVTVGIAHPFERRFGEVGLELEPGGLIIFNAYEDVPAAMIIPYLPIAIIAMIMPCAWVAGRTMGARRAKARRRGVCHVCGYDLRATPRKCPECGTRVKPADRANWHDQTERR